MSDERSGTGRLQDERINALTTRVDKLEVNHEQHRKEFIDLMVELKVLQQRVTLYAGLIAAAVSAAVKLMS